jgi:hypothetical protein
MKVKGIVSAIYPVKDLPNCAVNQQIELTLNDGEKIMLQFYNKVYLLKKNFVKIGDILSVEYRIVCKKYNQTEYVNNYVLWMNVK